MLNVQLNNEIKSVDYTVENNLTPTADEAVEIMKKICYSGDLRRNDNGYDAKGLIDFIYNYHLCAGMFENGHVRLKDESGTEIAKVDFWKTYSGSDTKRGSINLNESFRYSINGKLTARVSLDFPTHAANGSIKTLELYSKGTFETNGRKPDTRTSMKKLLYSGYENPKLCEDDSGNIFMFSSFDKKAFNFTTNKTYKITSNFSNAYIQYFRGSFWTVTEMETYSSGSFAKLKKLTFNEETLEISLNDASEIRIAPIGGGGSDHRYIQFIRDYNGKTFLGTVYGSSGDRVSLAILEENNTLSNIQTVYIGQMGLYFPMASIKPDTNGCIYIGGNHNNGNNIYAKYDLANTTISINSNRPDNTLLYNGNEAVMNNKRYIRYTAKAVNSSGQPDTYLEELHNDFKVPLKITMTEPLVKTSEQTMKLILDVEIE